MLKDMIAEIYRVHKSGEILFLFLMFPGGHPLRKAVLDGCIFLVEKG